MKNCVTAMVAGGVLLCGAAAAEAQSLGDDFKVTLGGGVNFAPEYEGGSQYEFSLIPALEVTWRDTVFLRTTKAGFILQNDAIEFGIVPSIGSSNFRAGAGFALRRGREANDSNSLPASDDIDNTIEVFLTAEYAFDYFRIDAKLNQGIDAFTDGHTGMLVEVGGSVGARFTPQIDALARLSATWASDDYMGTFFSTTSTTTQEGDNIAAFTAGEGVKDFGLQTQATYRITPNISLVGELEYKLLLDSAANSPLVRTVGDRNQFYGALTVRYSF